MARLITIRLGILLGIFVLVGFAAGCSSDGCDSTSCPNGCCDANGVCQLLTQQTCGIGGASCKACLAGQICNAGSCVAGPTLCDATSCPAGCCNGFGLCVDGNSALECGKGAAACKRCNTGERCIGQACQPVACDAISCASGCCSSDGRCVTTQSEQACGKQGVQCKQCSGNDRCLGGDCKVPPKPCDATICPDGCCDSAGNCQPGTADDALCGKGGQSCQKCSSTQQCVDSKCTCTATSCANGCCDGDFCRAGLDDDACGTSGEACGKCTAGKVCISGACNEGCSPATCKGCCDGNRCHLAGASDRSACGANGVACVSCTGNARCDQGSCNDPNACNPGTCPTGCCLGGKCELGGDVSACGGSGQTCRRCAAYELCQGQSCVVAPSSKWIVKLHKAKLDDTVTWDSLIGTDSRPDVYVKFNTGSYVWSSTIKANTYAPLFNEQVIKDKATNTVAFTAQELTTGIHYEVWDDDGWLPHTKIIACDTKFTSAQLSSGEATLTVCPTDLQNTYVEQLVFHFSTAP